MSSDDWAKLFDGLSRALSMLAGIFKSVSDDLKKRKAKDALQE
jgi:hypothetical protein